MAGIFIGDLNIKKVGHTTEGSKRPIEILQPILDQVTPQGITITRENPTTFGHIYQYQEDENANFIYNPSFKTFLENNNLKAEFTHSTSMKRNVFVINVPENIYAYDIPKITEEVVKSVKTRILEVRKFRNPSGINYLILTTSSQVARDEITATGTLKLFGVNIRAEKPKEKDRSGNFRQEPRRWSHTMRPPRSHMYHPNHMANQWAPPRPPNLPPPPPNAWSFRDFPCLPQPHATPPPRENLGPVSTPYLRPQEPRI